MSSLEPPTPYTHAAASAQGGVASAKSKRSKWLLAGLQALISVVLLWLSFSQVHFDEFATRMGQLSPVTLLVCAALTVLQFALLVERWRVLVRGLNHPIARLPLVSGTLGERLVNQVLPSTLGGDALRAVQILAAGAPKGVAFLSILADRGAGIVGMIFVCAVVSALGLALNIAPEVLIWTLIVGIGAAIGLALGLLAFDPRWISGPGLPLPGLRILAIEGLQLARKPAFLLAVGPYSMAIQAVFVAIYMLLARDIAPEINLISVLVLAPVVLLTAIVPITIGGWGLREAAAIGMFAGVGASSSAALGVSVAFGLLQSAIGLACGCLFLLVLALGKSSSHSSG